MTSDESSTARTALRRGLTVMFWLAAAGAVGLTGLRLSGLHLGWLGAAALAYLPYATLLVVLAAGAAALARAWLPLAVLGICAATLVALIAPRALPAPQPDPDGPTVTVMAINLFGGGGDGARVVELVRASGAEVLAVTELEPVGVASLVAAGIDELLPYQDLRPGYSVEGSGLYSAYPLTPAPELEPESWYAMPAAAVAVPGAPPVEVVAVHPRPPLWGDGAAAGWREELAALPPATGDGAVRVLAGDFNATLDHRPLRDLLATGYADASAATGAGLAGTWHGHGVTRRLPPLPLDRVLADDRAAVVSFEVHFVPGSDHQAVIAELTLPAG